jgi:hypothetical protein
MLKKNFWAARENKFPIEVKPMPDWKPAYEQANAVTKEPAFRFSDQLNSTTC